MCACVLSLCGWSLTSTFNPWLLLSCAAGWREHMAVSSREKDSFLLKYFLTVSAAAVAEFGKSVNIVRVCSF